VRPIEEFASVRQTLSIEGIETTLKQIMSFMLPAFHVGQAILASYTALLSYTSIVKLQKYEEMSKKVASYSNTAEHQLHKTRTTMTSGALSTLCSLLSCVALAIVSPRNDRRQLFLLSVVNTVACAFAHVHIRSVDLTSQIIMIHPFVSHCVNFVLIAISGEARPRCLP
jgi:hypothetical protein